MRRSRKVYMYGTLDDFNDLPRGDTNHEYVIMVPLDDYCKTFKFYQRNWRNTIVQISSKATPLYCTFIDLGLPSGIKWASCNLGASSPEEYGLCYVWGSTKGVTPTDDMSFELSPLYFDDMDTGDESKEDWTKFLTYLTNGDLLPLYDAAYTLNKQMRMPTRADVQELLANTTYEEVTKNGVLGMKLTSNNNGNSIFLPFKQLINYGSIPAAPYITKTYDLNDRVYDLEYTRSSQAVQLLDDYTSMNDWAFIRPVMDFTSE